MRVLRVCVGRVSSIVQCNGDCFLDWGLSSVPPASQRFTPEWLRVFGHNANTRTKKNMIQLCDMRARERCMQACGALAIAHRVFLA